MQTSRLAVALLTMPLLTHAAAPVEYTVSVATDSNTLGAMMFGGGGDGGGGFNLGSLLNRMTGKNLTGPQRSLQLELSTPARVNDFRASHDIPSGLKMGPTLLLAVPEPVQATPSEPDRDDEKPDTTPAEKPKGRLLIYWGCGEKPGAGQPKVIDFAKMTQADALSFSRRMSALNPAAIKALMQGVPTRSGTYASWPNRFQNTDVPSDGSLVGKHLLHGNFLADIGFELNDRQDFLAPADFRLKEGVLGTTLTLGWQTIPNAIGYSIMAMAGGDEGDTVLWASSQADFASANLLDYIPSDEVRRLQQKKVVLPAAATECKVPAPVFAANSHPMVMFIAYGEDVTASSRDKQNPWKLKVRYKSTALLMLNDERAAAAGGASSGGAAADGGRGYSSGGGRDYSSGRSYSSGGGSSDPLGGAKEMIKNKLKGLFGL